MPDVIADRHLGTFHVFTVRGIVKTNLQLTKRDLWVCQISRYIFLLQVICGAARKGLHKKELKCVRNSRNIALSYAGRFSGDDYVTVHAVIITLAQ